MFNLSLISYSQCFTAPTSFTVGQTYTFTSTGTAQCTSCYDWDINGSTTSSDNSTVGNLQIIGSDMGQSVSIKVLSTGSFTIQLTYINENGCQSCSRTFTVNNPSPTPLPTSNCFGYDPANTAFAGGQALSTSEGILNYGYIGSPYAAPISSTGLTFTWYFKLLNGTLLTFNVQNPTFRQICPYDPSNPNNNADNSPVKSFALIVSNGVQTKEYRSIDPNYPIPGISSIANTPTCFLHSECSPPLRTNGNIKVSPNPTKSTINFEGSDLDQYNITIFDENGNKIIENSKINTPIDIEHQKKGILFYKITNDSGTVQEGKILKE